MDHKLSLPAGYTINHYRIESVLGHGGFGITYLAHDESLKTDVAIKEYFPSDLATRLEDDTVSSKSEADTDDFDKGLEYFVREARTVAAYSHPSIIAVKHFFQENGTAYMVMPYEKGQSLAEILKQHGTLDESEIMEVLVPLLDALETVHEAGYLHRDIKPGNIYIREDGTPVLIDFGAARVAVGQKSKSLTSFVTEGYAPLELYYVGEDQGPWTDIYQLGATLYRAAFGEKPPEAPSRVRNDRLELAVERGEGKYSTTFLRGIDAALEVDPDDRPQSVAEWRRLFGLTAQDQSTVYGRLPSRAETAMGQRAAGVDPGGQPQPAKSGGGRGRILILSSVGAVFLLLAVGGGAWYAISAGLFRSGPAPAHDCDRLASDRWDPTRVGDGVLTIDPRDAPAAVQACRVALSDYPDEARFHAQLGRALIAAGNDAEAVGHLERAAAEPARHPLALTVFGRLLVEGRGIAADRERGWTLVRTAATAGHVGAQYYLGLAMMTGEKIAKDQQGGYRLLRGAADNGHPGAQYEVAQSLRTGRGVEQNESEAAGYFRMAAEQDHVRAQIWLSNLYYSGTGVEQDYQQSVRWARRAAEQGHRVGQFNLGFLYYVGRGVDQDYEAARGWFERAAEQGFANAHYWLGEIHELGRGVDQSLPEAYFHYLIAQRLGSEGAEERLTRIRNNMNLAQRLVGERRASEWRP